MDLGLASYKHVCDDRQKLQFTASRIVSEITNNPIFYSVYTNWYDRLFAKRLTEAL